MNLYSYHGKSKPLMLRVVSAFLIFAFILTQSDLRLAYSMPASVSVFPVALHPDSKKDNPHDSVFYEQDLTRELTKSGAQPPRKLSLA